MTVEVTLATKESDIGDNAKICYASKLIEDGGKDITHNLIHKNKHMSALRFAYATVKVEGISTACHTQVVRSPHLAFMVQSKRYVSIDKGEFKFIMPEGLNEEYRQIMSDMWDKSIEAYRDLVKSGVPKEDARAVLLSNTSTNMNITGNLQAWHSFFVLRLNSHAQLEIRTLANKIYDALALHFPNVFTAELKHKLSCAH